jgi:hypothetical protein
MENRKRDGSLQCDPGKEFESRRSKTLGDMKLHLEFWLPLMAESFVPGTARNSGVDYAIIFMRVQCARFVRACAFGG